MVIKDELEEDWLKKCLKCQHVYFRKNDADILCCRCRNGKCNFKLKKLRRKNNVKEFNR